MIKIEHQGTAIEFVDSGDELLFTIECDGTIYRGAGFTTTDEMSLKFWEAVDKNKPHYFFIKSEC